MHMCGSMMGMGGADVELCAPLQQLKTEHGPLRKQMDEYKTMVQDLAHDDSRSNYAEPLQALRDRVKQFVDELDVHSRKEEDVLFEMMANYIGRETGPIAVMEYEHDTAKTLLKQFLQLSSEVDNQVGHEQARDIADYAAKAEEILSQHFMKEETVLFPMAEKMLSAEEKEILQREIEKIK